MKRIGCLVSLCLLQFTLSPADLVGDFSPIAIGNKWTYSEKNSNRPKVGPGNYAGIAWSGIINIEILEKSISADTTIYTAHFRDSIFSRGWTTIDGINYSPIPDTTIEFDFKVLETKSDTLGISTPQYYYALRRMFVQHHFPESELFDTQYKERKIGTVVYNFGRYGKDVGMLSGWDGINGSYNLEEFNGNKFTISVFRKTIIPKKKVPYLIGQEIMMNGVIMSVLGRRAF